MIPGTDCAFGPLLHLGIFILECVVPDGIEIPQELYMSLEFTSDMAGWLIADFDDCPMTGPPGYSADVFKEEDLGSGEFASYWFEGCPANPQASYGVAMIVAAGHPWACCDLSTLTCVNVQETECINLGGVFTEGTLCNDLAAPCSEAGACCNTATGVCEDTFASHCDDYLEAFFGGELCEDVTCEVPPNVPTLTQWGMMGLIVLLLAGLTIKFGRRAVTA
jgi:hypothetical protein